ncbi:DoxX-like family protein [Lacinutrix venerupis]|uniref:DoxX-like protein n=1 Tax=Lacinutrix venerupis TaxID=1486034 RepID=A0AAC9LIS6_9FLAO|nr:DoxX-like family protein [Lacinutrix venerupis]APX99390.1 hypothetical protein BWR22_03385 [Lacinutrix venerupis]
MKNKKLNNTITFFIALVWLVNGLYCKILNQVPRHEAIVAKVLNTAHSRALIIIIGVLEVFMAVWILSRYKQKCNAITQIVIILTMNSLELLKASNLLLWHNFNIVFALLFCSLIYYNSFHFNLIKDNV